MLSMSCSWLPWWKSVRPMLFDKQHIAHKGAVDLVAHGTPHARRAARAVAHIQRLVAHLHRVSPSCSQRVGVKRCAAESRTSRFAAAARQSRTDRPGVAPRWAAASAGANPARASRMVDMGVRGPDLSQRKPQAIHLAQQHIQVAPGSITAAWRINIAPRWRRFAGRG